MKLKTQLKIKRLFDFVFSVFLLIFLSPLLLLVSVLVKLSSDGPVLFLQNRPGLNGTIFTIYKFRTMRLNSDDMIPGVEVMHDDPRITLIGRFLRRTKLDELPQVFNVIRGEMSFVGPRPERVSSLENYDDFIKKRLLVRPGITGLAQVNGNIYLDLDRRYFFDVFYVENYSLFLDFRIFAKTVLLVFLGERFFLSGND